MTDDEKKLRQWIGQHTDAPNGHVLLELLLAEHRAEVAAARDAALEEAAQRCETRAADLDKRQWSDEDSAVVDKYAMRISIVEDRQRMGRDIRALRSQPAQSIPVSKVRYELTESRLLLALNCPQLYLDGWNAAVEDVGRRLGVPLDAEPGAKPRWLGRWSNQTPQHVHLGDEDRRPDDSEDQP